MLVFLAMFLVVGGIFIGLSIPLIKGNVPPNRWYGFRVPRTLNDPQVWYPANAYAGWRLLWVGILTLIVAIAAYFIPNLEMVVYTFIVAGVVVMGVAITLVQSFSYLGTLTDERSPV